LLSTDEYWQSQRRKRQGKRYDVMPEKQPNFVQFCEVAMEKRQSRSLSKPIPLVSDARYTSPINFAEPPAKPDKVSREDISRCINIWAHLYRQCDSKSDPHDLYLPSRPWMGRDPNSIKRFE
jgi:hypothetical protein